MNQVSCYVSLKHIASFRIAFQGLSLLLYPGSLREKGEGQQLHRLTGDLQVKVRARPSQVRHSYNLGSKSQKGHLEFKVNLAA